MAKVTRGITRFDYGNTHGFVVRYMRDGAMFHRLFSDGRYGSAEAALETAKLYLAELRNAFPPMSRREFAEIKRKNNGSDVVGVYRHRNKSKGHVYEFWVAMWSPRERQVKHKSFSINKYGEDKAKQLAIEARQAGLQEMEAEWSDPYKEYAARADSSSGSTASSIFINHYAFEGEPFYRLHLDRERDKALREAAIENYKAKHADIRCEICGFSFEEKYGVMGEGLIEVHHIIPLSTLEAGAMTSVEDLMLVCANCHFVIHNGIPEETLKKLKILFSGEDLTNKRRPMKTVKE